jgi:hypothetical protein
MADGPVPLRFTWGQVKLIAQALGLADDDPQPDAGMILVLLDARQTVQAEHERQALGLGDDDD